MSFTIIGTGSAVPECIKTNEDLSSLVETSDEWIQTRTGIIERHICTKETLTDLAAKASEAALEDAGISGKDLDLIICATVRADDMTPSMSAVIQQIVGAECPCFDINAACSGFIFAMDAALGYFARKRVKNVLIIASEAMSKLADWSDRATCVLFGDAAGAIVVTEGDDLMAIKITTTGSKMLRIPNVEGNCPFSEHKESKSYLHMNGQEVFKFAVNSICKDINDVMKEAGVTEEQIDHVLLHQANKRISNTAEKYLNIPSDKYRSNIERYGNTSSASIPLLLDEINKTKILKKGDIIAMSAFGGGLTSAACIIKWNK